MDEYVKWYPWVQGVVLLVFFVVVYALKKSFASKDDVSAQDKRLQTVEQTYVKNEDFAEVKAAVQRIEVEVKDLPQNVSALSKEVAKLQGENNHLHDLLKRIEHPLNLIVESKISGKQ